jgi:hypothetical protein
VENSDKLFLYKTTATVDPAGLRLQASQTVETREIQIKPKATAMEILVKKVNGADDSPNMWMSIHYSTDNGANFVKAVEVTRRGLRRDRRRRIVDAK